MPFDVQLVMLVAVTVACAAAGTTPSAAMAAAMAAIQSLGKSRIPSGSLDSLRLPQLPRWATELARLTQGEAEVICHIGTGRRFL